MHQIPKNLVHSFCIMLLGNLSLWALVVCAVNLKVSLRMCAGGADLGSLCANYDVTTVAAFPYLNLTLLEYLSCLNVLQECAITLLMMRINGVAGQFAELLEASGVDTVKELKHRVPANLQAKMVEVNEVKNLVNRVPNLAEVEKMVAQAKELEAVITY